MTISRTFWKKKVKSTVDAIIKKHPGPRRGQRALRQYSHLLIQNRKGLLDELQGTGPTEKIVFFYQALIESDLIVPDLISLENHAGADLEEVLTKIILSFKKESYSDDQIKRMLTRIYEKTRFDTAKLKQKLDQRAQLEVQHYWFSPPRFNLIWREESKPNNRLSSLLGGMNVGPTGIEAQDKEWQAMDHRSPIDLLMASNTPLNVINKVARYFKTSLAAYKLQQRDRASYLYINNLVHAVKSYKRNPTGQNAENVKQLYWALRTVCPEQFNSGEVFGAVQPKAKKNLLIKLNDQMGLIYSGRPGPASYRCVQRLERLGDLISDDYGRTHQKEKILAWTAELSLSPAANDISKMSEENRRALMVLIGEVRQYCHAQLLPKEIRLAKEDTRWIANILKKESSKKDPSPTIISEGQDVIRLLHEREKLLSKGKSNKKLITVSTQLCACFNIFRRAVLKSTTDDRERWGLKEKMSNLSENYAFDRREYIANLVSTIINGPISGSKQSAIALLVSSKTSLKSPAKIAAYLRKNPIINANESSRRFVEAYVLPLVEAVKAHKLYPTKKNAVRRLEVYQKLKEQLDFPGLKPLPGFYTTGFDVDKNPLLIGLGPIDKSANRDLVKLRNALCDLKNIKDTQLVKKIKKLIKKMKAVSHPINSIWKARSARQFVNDLENFIDHNIQADKTNNLFVSLFSRVKQTDEKETLFHDLFHPRAPVAVLERIIIEFKKFESKQTEITDEKFKGLASKIASSVLSYRLNPTSANSDEVKRHYSYVQILMKEKKFFPFSVDATKDSILIKLSTQISKLVRANNEKSQKVLYRLVKLREMLCDFHDKKNTTQAEYIKNLTAEMDLSTTVAKKDVDELGDGNIKKIIDEVRQYVLKQELEQKETNLRSELPEMKSFIKENSKLRKAIDGRPLPPTKISVRAIEVPTADKELYSVIKISHLIVKMRNEFSGSKLITSDIIKIIQADPILEDALKSSPALREALEFIKLSDTHFCLQLKGNSLNSITDQMCYSYNKFLGFATDKLNAAGPAHGSLVQVLSSYRHDLTNAIKISNSGLSNMRFQSEEIMIRYNDASINKIREPNDRMKFRTALVAYQKNPTPINKDNLIHLADQFQVRLNLPLLPPPYDETLKRILIKANEALTLVHKDDKQIRELINILSNLSPDFNEESTLIDRLARLESLSATPSSAPANDARYRFFPWKQNKAQLAARTCMNDARTMLDRRIKELEKIQQVAQVRYKI